MDDAGTRWAVAVTKVLLSSRAQKDLRRVPMYVVEKLQEWVAAVELVGLREVRKTPGYHDEP